MEKNLTIDDIVKEAWKDEDFKQALLANPTEAIEGLAGQPITNTRQIEVVDQSDSSKLYINLTPNPEDVELTEEELETVSGGSFNIICFIFSSDTEEME